MESPQRQNEDNDAQYNTKVMKTQDDFAEYLTGDKPLLDEFIETRQEKLDNLQLSSSSPLES